MGSNNQTSTCWEVAVGAIVLVEEAAPVYGRGKTCVRAQSRAARDCLRPAGGCETKHEWC
jgi:hypothetical protein